MPEQTVTLNSLSEAVEYVQQGLTGVQIREHLERDHSLTPSEARQIIVFARSFVYRLTPNEQSSTR